MKPTLLLLLAAAAVHAETHRVIGEAYYHTFSAAHPMLARVKPGDTIITKTVDSAGFDYLGIRRLNLGMDALTARDDAVSKRQLALAADAFAHAADTAPSPRILQQWALAATMMGDLETAQDVYHRMLARDPGNAMGWLGLATASFNKKDFVESRRAAERLLQLQPGNPDATRLIHDLDLVESGQATVP